MKYFSDEIQTINFTGDSHVENHFNYLFRTDKKQKWTNNDTKYNAFGLPSKDGLTLYGIPEDLKERTEIKNDIENMIMPFGYENLYMARVECTNPEIYYWNKDMISEMKELVADIKKTVLDYSILLVIIHDDQPQNYTHFHMLLLYKGE